MTVTIKKSQHRYIIGTKGAAIQEVYKATGVIVEVPGPEDPSENVVMRGPQEQLAAAAALIFERVSELRCFHL